MTVNKIFTKKFVEDYKIQCLACVAGVALALLAAIIIPALAGETASLALRIYFVIHPATVVAAIPLETLALVALVMNERSPRAFFESAATTSLVVTGLCAVLAMVETRREGLMATVTLPYCALVLAVSAAAFAVCVLRDRRAAKRP